MKVIYIYIYKIKVIYISVEDIGDLSRCMRYIAMSTPRRYIAGVKITIFTKIAIFTQFFLKHHESMEKIAEPADNLGIKVVFVFFFSFRLLVEGFGEKKELAISLFGAKE